MELKAKWKKIEKDYEHDKVLVRKEDGIPLPGEECLIVGTYVDDYSRRVRIGIVIGRWGLNEEFMLPDFYTDFNPLYWDYLEIKNPIKIAIGEKVENKGVY